MTGPAVTTAGLMVPVTVEQQKPEESTKGKLALQGPGMGDLLTHGDPSNVSSCLAFGMMKSRTRDAD